jgi:hypothetical protein
MDAMALPNRKNTIIPDQRRKFHGVPPGLISRWETFESACPARRRLSDTTKNRDTVRTFCLNCIAAFQASSAAAVISYHAVIVKDPYLGRGLFAQTVT